LWLFAPTPRRRLETPTHSGKGNTDFLPAPVPLAFRHHLSALIIKVTAARNRPVVRIITTSIARAA
jgi:hypothetical protein